MADPVTHTIVGVDDDVRIRESIESLIESAGFASLVFPSAEEFLGSGKLAEVSCLITDVRMPGIDGIELQRRVKLHRPELPVIFISGHYDAEIRCRALDGGAFDFIYKPFDAFDLLAAVNRAISKCPDGRYPM
jgi:FixJ family two-component response regulator